jgi:hypothetical protein
MQTSIKNINKRENRMSYSEFTLDGVTEKFELEIQERVELFSSVEPINPSSLLREILEENMPLALEIDTEKARSEMIVVPVLIELRKHFKRQISLFSGIDFNVDPTKGLNGRCDFIISHSPYQLSLTAPVATLVEAKNDNIKSGIPQCLAEMVGAKIFNTQKNNNISCIYGTVTTGSLWKFLRLEGNTVLLEAREHFIGNLESILGILAQLVHTSRPNSSPFDRK